MSSPTETAASGAATGPSEPPPRAEPAAPRALGLHAKSTAERTEEELRIAYELYVQSKTVGGRFCPTPELVHEEEGEAEAP